MLTEKKTPPPITFSYIGGQRGHMVTFFSCFIDKSNITNLFSWLPISTILEPEHCPITLCTVQSDTTPPLEFVFMNREGMNKEFFYMYDCLFHSLHVRVPFNNFTMGVLWILNMAFSTTPKWVGDHPSVLSPLLKHLGEGDARPVPPLLFLSSPWHGPMGVLNLDPKKSSFSNFYIFVYKFQDWLF